MKQNNWEKDFKEFHWIDVVNNITKGVPERAEEDMLNFIKSQKDLSYEEGYQQGYQDKAQNKLKKSSKQL